SQARLSRRRGRCRARLGPAAGLCIVAGAMGERPVARRSRDRERRTRMSETTLHVVIRGQVQGVGYRAFVEDEAALRGLEGWGRNRRDGSVEVVFVGPAEEVKQMVEACRRGPGPAKVEAVDHRPGGPELLAQRRTNEKFSVLSTI